MADFDAALCLDVVGRRMEYDHQQLPDGSNVPGTAKPRRIYWPGSRHDLFLIPVDKPDLYSGQLIAVVCRQVEVFKRFKLLVGSLEH